MNKKYGKFRRCVNLGVPQGPIYHANIHCGWPCTALHSLGVYLLSAVDFYAFSYHATKRAGLLRLWKWTVIHLRPSKVILSRVSNIDQSNDRPVASPVIYLIPCPPPPRSQVTHLGNKLCSCGGQLSATGSTIDSYKARSMAAKV